MNVYLMDFYDEYDKNKSIKKLEDFTAISFPKDGTDKLFIGCVLILITTAYRTKTTSEALTSILLSVKENIENNEWN